MALRWYTTVVDSHDIAAQARWWADVLGWQLIYESEHEAVIIPAHAPTEPLPAEEWTRTGPGLVFVPVSEDKTIKNRLHIDLAPHLADDRDALIAGLIDRGATPASVGQDVDSVSWTVLADPEGNEFCVLSARDQ